MILVFDIDDTIANTDICSEKYIDNFIKENKLPYELVDKVARFAEKKFSWDADTALNWYKEYGDAMMLEFTCRDNAVEIINELYDEGHTIIIATARSTDWHKDPVGTTKKWLDNIGLKYHKLYTARSDKENICKDEGASLFLDDDVKIVERVANTFRTVGGRACLFNTDYNKDIEVSEDIIRVNSFAEFLGVAQSIK